MVTSPVNNKILRGVAMASASDGWAVGDGGTILGWDGNSWQIVTSPITSTLSAVAMVAPSDGWAVGDGGTILRYQAPQSTTVATWQVLAIGTPEESFYDVAMVSAGEGWLVGSHASILGWNGSDWRAGLSPTSAHLRSVAMVSPNDGWIVGDGGTILRWDGNSWSAFAGPITSTLSAVAMASTSDGWAVGDSGTILRWNGASWQRAASPTTANLYGVAMVSTTDGWAVGWGGTILRWDGTSWQSVSSPTIARLYGVAMASASDGWAVGAGGAIVRYSVAATSTATPTSTSTASRTTTATATPTSTNTLTATATTTAAANPTATPDRTVPRIIAGPYVTDLTEQSVRIIWTTDEPATSVVGSGASATALDRWIEQAALVVGHELTFGGLQGETTYFYRVQSTDAAGNTVSSTVASFVTLARPDTTAPGFTVSPRQATAGDGTVVLVWQTDEPATGVIEYGFGPSALTGTLTATQLLEGQWVTIDGLPADTVMYVRVRVRDVAGNEAESRVIPVRTAAAPDRRAPAVVIAPVVESVGQTTAVIAWWTDEPSSSRVDFGTDRTFTRTVVVTGAVTLHRVDLTYLEPATTYRFRARSTDAAGNEVVYQSGELTFTTLAEERSRPLGLTQQPVAIDVGNRVATIIWQTSRPGDGVVEYGLATGAYTLTQPVAELGVSHRVVLSRLLPGTTYYYRARSTDRSGQTVVSAEYTFRTTGETVAVRAPVIVAGPAAQEVLTDTAAIVWQTDPSGTSEVLYGQAVGTVGELGQSSLELTPVRHHRVRLSRLTPGAVYSYVVRSEDGAGTVVTSTLRTFRTEAAAERRAPVLTHGPLVVARTSDRAVVAWQTDRSGTSRVEWGPADDPSAVEAVELAEDVTEHRVTLTGLQADRGYRYLVGTTSAESRLGVTSEWLTFRTHPAPDRDAPLVIGGPTVEYVTTNRALVAWQTDEDATSEVEYRGGGESGQVADDRYDKRHRLWLTNLQPSTRYTITVRSVDASGNARTSGSSPASFLATAAGLDLLRVEGFMTPATPDTTQPAIRGAAVAFVGNDRAVIQWQTDEPASSAIRIGTGGSPADWPAIVGSFASSPQHEIVATNLTPGAVYSFTVNSTDPSDNSAESAVLSFQTLALPDTTPPQILAGPQVVVTDTAFVSWTTNEPSSSLAEFVTAGVDSSSGDVAYVTSHRLALGAPTAGVANELRVRSADPAGNPVTTTVTWVLTQPGVPTTVTSGDGRCRAAIPGDVAGTSAAVVLLEVPGVPASVPASVRGLVTCRLDVRQGANLVDPLPTVGVEVSYTGLGVTDPSRLVVVSVDRPTLVYPTAWADTNRQVATFEVWRAGRYVVAEVRPGQVVPRVILFPVLRHARLDE